MMSRIILAGQLCHTNISSIRELFITRCAGTDLGAPDVITNFGFDCDKFPK